MKESVAPVLFLFINYMVLQTHLRNQKLSLRRISSKYPRKYHCLLKNRYIRFFFYKLIFVMCASQNVTAHCIAPPIFVFPEYVLSPTTLCKWNIKPKTVYNLFILMCSKNISTYLPSWRRYTFLSHLTTKSKISVRWIKKLVAATYCVYVFLQRLLNLHS